jgi:hypothetical protein
MLRSARRFTPSEQFAHHREVAKLEQDQREQRVAGAGRHE